MIVKLKTGDSIQLGKHEYRVIQTTQCADGSARIDLVEQRRVEQQENFNYQYREPSET